jgi:hypothetical protein
MGKKVIHYIMVFFLVAISAICCTKQSPDSLQSGNQETISENNKAAGAKSARSAEHHGFPFSRKHGPCFRPGMPMETSGVFDFPIDSTLPGYTQIYAFLGGRSSDPYNLTELFYSNYLSLFNICNMTIYVSDFKYFITATVNDLQGNLLIQIQDNAWHVNRNAIHKFNYDDNGLEVIDREGHVAISIDFGGTIYVQGIIPCTSTSLGYYVLPEFSPTYTEGVFQLNIPYGTPELNKDFEHLYDSLPIKPMFRYVGRDWQHSRLK